jgi:hypothetical protein
MRLAVVMLALAGACGTRPPERGYALAEVALAVAIVLIASVPGLRARFAKRPPAA